MGFSFLISNLNVNVQLSQTEANIKLCKSRLYISLPNHSNSKHTVNIVIITNHWKINCLPQILR